MRRVVSTARRWPSTSKTGTGVLTRGRCHRWSEGRQPLSLQWINEWSRGNRGPSGSLGRYGTFAMWGFNFLDKYVLIPEVRNFRDESSEASTLQVEFQLRFSGPGSRRKIGRGLCREPSGRPSPPRFFAFCKQTYYSEKTVRLGRHPQATDVREVAIPFRNTDLHSRP